MYFEITDFIGDTDVIEGGGDDSADTVPHVVFFCVTLYYKD